MYPIRCHYIPVGDELRHGTFFSRDFLLTLNFNALRRFKRMHAFFTDIVYIICLVVSI